VTEPESPTAERSAERQTTESPCTGVCAIDPVNGRCLGCRRTLFEITVQYSPKERRGIMTDLPTRARRASG
jgi:predicted Fe-S protein YdhL (DUF1289 family)